MTDTVADIKINKLVTHAHPHLDEAFALLAIQRWCVLQAEKIGPGSSKAKIGFMTTGMLPQGKTWRDHPNTWFIGCGKGPFDEHWSNLAKDKPECAATLVAQALGVADKREFQNPLYHILHVDQKGSGNRLSIASVLNLIYHMAKPPSMLGILDWVADAYAAEFNDQKDHRYRDTGILTIERAHRMMKDQGGDSAQRADRWFALARKALDERGERANAVRPLVKAATSIRIEDSAFGSLCLVTVESDNDQVASVVWGLNKDDVLVCFRSTGNVQIMTRKNRNICLSKVAALVRGQELISRGEPLPDDQLDLYDVDMVPGEQRWHLMDTDGDAKRMLFNGSTSAPDVEPTIIPRVRLLELVQRGLMKN